MIEPRSSVARSGFLDLLDQQDRNELCSLGVMRQYRRGARIMRQGDQSDSVVVLLDGSVKVALDTEDGAEVVLDVFGPGDVLGEFEAVGEYTTRAANVVALSSVGCRVLAKDTFLEYLIAHPAASLALVRLMIRRLDVADQRRIDATTADASRTLARFLIETVDADESAGADAIAVSVPLAQHELASLIGVSRNSVVRALTTLRSRHLVTTTRRTITIVDVPALRAYGHAHHESPRPPRALGPV